MALAVSTWNYSLARLDAALNDIGGDPVDWGQVKIAQLDTGYTEHPAFGDWLAGAVPLRVAEGVNYLEEGTPPIDPLTGEGLIQTPGHGTRIASVLCAPRRSHRQQRRTFTFSGAAPGVPVVPYRAVEDVVLEPQAFNRRIWLNLAKAGNDAIGPKACKIVSISLGGPLFPGPELGAAIDAAYEKGVIVLAAGGQLIDRVTYPGKFDRVIGVGGLKRSERELRVYNHYDDHSHRIDVWAPADPIFRADTTLGRGKAPVFGWGDGEGTSYATVHVAAAAAMWLVKHKNALAQYPEWRTVEAFRDALSRSYGTLPRQAGAPQRHYTSGTLLAYDLLRTPLAGPQTLTYNPRRAELEEW